MLVPIIRLIFVLVGTIVGASLARLEGISDLVPFYHGIILIIGFVLVGAGIGYVLGGVVGRRLNSFVDWVESVLRKIPASDIVLGATGLVVGFIIAFLLSPTLQKIGLVGVILSIFSFILLGMLGVYLSLRKRGDLQSMIRSLSYTRDTTVQDRSLPEKVIDTSTIIDGRIADICQIGFIEGRINVPRFVLKELQDVADSNDDLKRTRGRRGLDILGKLQRESLTQVRVIDKDYSRIKDVDEKLVKLAEELEATLITNDYNLNKVARLQGVRVLNVNELANALKPVVVPGEEMTVHITKEGKEPKQGVGYLDDGTMIVVEEGKKFIGKKVTAVVTSVLQTPAGKMIFTKLREG